MNIVENDSFIIATMLRVISGSVLRYVATTGQKATQNLVMVQFVSFLRYTKSFGA